MFPDCGCDACDDDAQSVAERLEWAVRTVGHGGYSEQIDSWPGRWIGYRLDELGVGMQSGRSGTRDSPNERVELARTALPTAGRWASRPPIPQAEGGAKHPSP